MKKKKRTKYFQYTANHFFTKLIKFFVFLFTDLRASIKNGREFNEYGLTMYCGKQGAGKTISMVEYLERMRVLYPDAIIVTNFGYQHEHMQFSDWKMFYEVRNGTKGVIFAIDEIQNEFESNAWKTFPPNLLREITQQRKQRIKVVATSQVFTRVVKPLREQTFEVVECFTFIRRWTFTKAFDAQEYEAVIQNPTLKNKLRRLWRKNFVQDKKIRNLFDSYAKIEAMKNTEYIPVNERLSSK